MQLLARILCALGLTVFANLALGDELPKPPGVEVTLNLYTTQQVLDLHRDFYLNMGGSSALQTSDGQFYMQVAADCDIWANVYISPRFVLRSERTEDRVLYKTYVADLDGIGAAEIFDSMLVRPETVRVDGVVRTQKTLASDFESFVCSKQSESGTTCHIEVSTWEYINSNLLNAGRLQACDTRR